MRYPLLEGIRVTSEHERRSIQTEVINSPDEAFQQPTAEEPRSTSDEEALPAQLLP